MHNLVPRAQMEEWRHFEKTVDELEVEMQKVNDYYECLIECEENQSQCKRICRRLLM